MKFIKLTAERDTRENIYINMERVFSMKRQGKYTILAMSEGTLVTVAETPEEIMEFFKVTRERNQGRALD
jgi:hypothetical protein